VIHELGDDFVEFALGDVDVSEEPGAEGGVQCEMLHGSIPAIRMDEGGAAAEGGQ
jgi:hypothetical protein